MSSGAMTATYGMVPARVPLVTPKSSGGVGLPEASLRSVAIAWRNMPSISTVLRHGNHMRNSQNHVHQPHAGHAQRERAGNKSGRAHGTNVC